MSQRPQDLDTEPRQPESETVEGQRRRQAIRQRLEQEVDGARSATVREVDPGVFRAQVETRQGRQIERTFRFDEARTEVTPEQRAEAREQAAREIAAQAGDDVEPEDVRFEDGEAKLSQDAIEAQRSQEIEDARDRAVQDALEDAPEGIRARDITTRIEDGEVVAELTDKAQERLRKRQAAIERNRVKLDVFEDLKDELPEGSQITITDLNTGRTDEGRFFAELRESAEQRIFGPSQEELITAVDRAIEDVLADAPEGVTRDDVSARVEDGEAIATIDDDALPAGGEQQPADGDADARQEAVEAVLSDAPAGVTRAEVETERRGDEIVARVAPPALAEIRQERAEDQLESATGLDLQPGVDFTTTTEDGEVRAELTEQGRRRRATGLLESRLEEQTGIDVEPGEDFEVSSTDDGFVPELTTQGRRRIGVQRRREDPEALTPPSQVAQGVEFETVAAREIGVARRREDADLLTAPSQTEQGIEVDRSRAPLVLGPSPTDTGANGEPTASELAAVAAQSPLGGLGTTQLLAATQVEPGTDDDTTTTTEAAPATEETATEPADTGGGPLPQQIGAAVSDIQEGFADVRADVQGAFRGDRDEPEQDLTGARGQIESQLEQQVGVDLSAGDISFQEATVDGENVLRAELSRQGRRTVGVETAPLQGTAAEPLTEAGARLQVETSLAAEDVREGIRERTGIGGLFRGDPEAVARDVGGGLLSAGAVGVAAPEPATSVGGAGAALAGGALLGGAAAVSELEAPQARAELPLQRPVQEQSEIEAPREPVTPPSELGAPTQRDPTELSEITVPEEGFDRPSEIPVDESVARGGEDPEIEVPTDPSEITLRAEGLTGEVRERAEDERLVTGEDIADPSQPLSESERLTQIREELARRREVAREAGESFDDLGQFGVRVRPDETDISDDAVSIDPEITRELSEPVGSELADGATGPILSPGGAERARERLQAAVEQPPTGGPGAIKLPGTLPGGERGAAPGDRGFPQPLTSVRPSLTTREVTGVSLGAEQVTPASTLSVTPGAVAAQETDEPLGFGFETEQQERDPQGVGRRDERPEPGESARRRRQRRRQPEQPDIDADSRPGGAGGDPDPFLAPGFLSETIRDAATRGGPAREAEQEELAEAATTADLLTGEIPTGTELFGTEAEQEAIEETESLFVLGDGDDQEGLL